MKYIKHLPLFFGALLFVTHYTTLAQSIADSNSYFPLNLDNAWAFSDLAGSVLIDTHEERIISTKVINGNLYFGLNVHGSSIIHSWLRVSNDSVLVRLGWMDTTETLLYNFNSKVGDTLVLSLGFNCFYGSTMVFKGREDTVVAPVGTFTHCLHFQHLHTCADAGMFDSWLALGVGRVKYKEDNIGGLITHVLDSVSIITEVNHPTATVRSPGFFLLDSYPNPFNPKTTLSYHIDKSSFVSLKIVDLLGREIVSLVTEQKRPGIIK